MPAPKIVFMHVGEELTLLTRIFIAGVRRVMPDAFLIQCTDHETQQLQGINAIFRCNADRGNLMTFRLQAFSQLNLHEPAIYCDTDMGILKALDPETLIGDADVALCRRSYRRDQIYAQVEFRGKVYDEHFGKKWDDVYPYVACFSVARSPVFWTDCLNTLLSMPEKWHYWMGDQEAMREVARSGRYKIRDLPEDTYGNLPDEPKNAQITPLVLHFKGRTRKPLMLEWAKTTGIAK